MTEYRIIYHSFETFSEPQALFSAADSYTQTYIASAKCLK